MSGINAVSHASKHGNEEIHLSWNLRQIFRTFPLVLAASFNGLTLTTGRIRKRLGICWQRLPWLLVLRQSKGKICNTATPHLTFISYRIYNPMMRENLTVTGWVLEIVPFPAFSVFDTVTMRRTSKISKMNEGESKTCLISNRVVYSCCDPRLKLFPKNKIHELKGSQWSRDSLPLHFGISKWSVYPDQITWIMQNHTI